jgi:hypothetical protein
MVVECIGLLEQLGVEAERAGLAGRAAGTQAARVAPGAAAKGLDRLGDEDLVEAQPLRDQGCARRHRQGMRGVGAVVGEDAGTLGVAVQVVRRHLSGARTAARGLADETRGQRTAGRGIHVALEVEDGVGEGRVVVAVEVGEGEAEAVPAPLDAAADLEAADVPPGILRAVDPGHADAERAVGEDAVGDRAHHVGRVRLSARAEVRRLELVEVERQLETHVLERAHVVERVDEARRPQGDARLLEARQRGQGEVLGVELVRGAEELRLAPDDVLQAEAHPQAAVEHLDVDVRLLDLLGALLAGTAVEGALDLAEVEVEAVEIVVGDLPLQAPAGQVAALGDGARRHTGAPRRLGEVGAEARHVGRRTEGILAAAPDETGDQSLLVRGVRVPVRARSAMRAQHAEAPRRRAAGGLADLPRDAVERVRGAIFLVLGVDARHDAAEVAAEDVGHDVAEELAADVEEDVPGVVRAGTRKLDELDELVARIDARGREAVCQGVAQDRVRHGIVEARALVEAVAVVARLHPGEEAALHPPTIADRVGQHPPAQGMGDVPVERDGPDEVLGQPGAQDLGARRAAGGPAEVLEGERVVEGVLVRIAGGVVARALGHAELERLGLDDLTRVLRGLPVDPRTDDAVAHVAQTVVVARLAKEGVEARVALALSGMAGACGRVALGADRGGLQIRDPRPDPAIVSRLPRRRRLGPSVFDVAGIAQPLGQTAREVAVGVDAREHPEALGVDGVVAPLDADVGLEQVEGADPVGREVGLELQVDDVVPLGEIELLGEPLVEGADLHLHEAVHLQAPVEGLHRTGARPGRHADRDAG